MSEPSTKIPYRRIEPDESIEHFMASLNEWEIYEHPETLRLMRKSMREDTRIPE